jgi:hypothetical protein
MIWKTLDSVDVDDDDDDDEELVDEDEELDELDKLDEGDDDDDETEILSSSSRWSPSASTSIALSKYGNSLAGAQFIHQN